MNTPNFQDRRMFSRFSIRFPIQYNNTSNNKYGFAQTHDISAGGVCFESQEDVSIGSRLSLEVCDSSGTECLTSQGEVIWKRPLGARKYRVGVKFDAIRLIEVARVLYAFRKNQPAVYS